MTDSNPYQSPAEDATERDRSQLNEERVARKRSPFADSSTTLARWWTVGISAVVGPVIYFAIQIPAITRLVIFFGTIVVVFFVLRPKRTD